MSADERKSKPFGEIFRLYLVLNQISMEETGARIGVSKATISRLCNGEMPGAINLIKLINWMFL